MQDEWPNPKRYDRHIAAVLFCGGLFVAFDLPWNISSNHNLWAISLVPNFIYPLGLCIVAFWGLRMFGIGSTRLWAYGWSISLIWHTVWLAFLTFTIFGLIGVFIAAPLLLLWMIACAVLSGMALIETFHRIQDAELDTPNDSDIKNTAEQGAAANP